MACIHGLSPHDCQDPRCSTVATATAESTSTSEYSSSEGHESSSDEVDVIVDDMRTANLARSRPNNNNSNALKKGFTFAVPKSIKARMARTNTWESDRQYHESLVSSAGSTGQQRNVHREEIRTTPLFSADVLAHAGGTRPETRGDVLPQYGFLAKVLNTYGGHDERSTDDLLASESNGWDNPVNQNSQSSATNMDDSRLFINMNAPWSAFICGSQGSGKSHTLSCMLESALKPSRLGKLPNPLAAIVFHYDKFTGFAKSQICEAALLCSAEIPVTVLVSPSNWYRMKDAYENIPELSPNTMKPVVAPLLLEERHLNVERMMKLMAIDEKEGKISLYMESVCKILRSMAITNQHTPGLNYKDFKKRVKLENFNDGQTAMLNTRLQLLESFMYLPETTTSASTSQIKPDYTDTKKGRAKMSQWHEKDDERERAKIARKGIWSFQPGSLTIVDLSCPFVDESAACAMFNICLALFLEDRGASERVVALDEAHKFMTGTDSSSAFTESLLSVIRLQRHLGTRVIIATQEPTISPRLLDLTSMTIVHRFDSVAWLEVLKSHLAAVSSKSAASKGGAQDIFDQIVALSTGQALVFSPSAMLWANEQDKNGSRRMLKLGTQYIKVQVRQRITADGGRSILAA